MSDLHRRASNALRRTDSTVATAESCTDGRVAYLLTRTPGASDYFETAFVTYTYDSKTRHLGIDRETLDRHGAVSEEVAAEMAKAARDRAVTTWGVSTTGYAGPTGGDDEDPVGTAYVAVSYAGDWGSEESYTVVERIECDGDRDENRDCIARKAVELLSYEIDD
ncbi:MAG: CinA family protein [Halobacteria archaeon]|nr:CinA family protein [Halobacteria archaeon]